MRNLLIGGSGLIGSFLSRIYPFDEIINSQQFPGQKNYSRVFCAAPSAKKWQANKQPDQDLSSVLSIFEKLDSINCSSFVLISTVDVYKDVRDANECSSTASENTYGMNRIMLDKYVRSRFDSYSILRLGGIIDTNIVKNPIYDVVNGINLSGNLPNSRMQFIPLSAIPMAISILEKISANTINLCSEPIALSEIQELTTNRFTGDQIQEYDIKSSVLQDLYGKRYINTKLEVLELIKEYAEGWPK